MLLEIILIGPPPYPDLAVRYGDLASVEPPPMGPPPRLAPPPRLLGLEFAPVAQTGNLSESIQNFNNQTKHESVILDPK